MKEQIEVEVRGKILDFSKTLDFFKKNAQFVEEKDRLSFIYFREDVKDVSEIKDELVDLRVRITNKKAEIVMKYGKWGSQESRKEFSFPISNENFGPALDFFKCLGWTKGVMMDTKTFVFNYEGIEFALASVGKNSYFEAEILVNSQKNIESANKKIKEVCSFLNLDIFSEGEFISLINYLNSRKEYLFDMEKENFEDIKEKFEEYF
ncbi:MAG: hypothetical protein PHI40_05835 [Caldisericia bacterium]|nr:hypothetical protein [Caldisericia bacterium]